MKGKLCIGLVFSVMLGCASGGGNKSEDSNLKAESGSGAVPTNLGGKNCNQVIDFNDRSEVLLECGGDLETFNAVSYAIWDGKSLRDVGEMVKLPALGANSVIFLLRLGNNGAVFGNVGDLSEEGTLYSPTKGFSATADNLTMFPETIGGASRDGNSCVTSSPVFGRFTAYHNDTPYALAPFPETVQLLNQISQIRNDQTVAGTVEVGSDGQSFAAGYGFLLSANSFELLPPPGRTELASAFHVRVNNSGSTLLMYEKNLTYTVVFDDQHTEQRVVGAVLTLKNGEQLDIAPPVPLADVSVGGVSDSDIVWGEFSNQSQEDLEPNYNFVFSPRSGVKPAQELFPEFEFVIVNSINAKNEAVITTDKGIFIRSMPKDF